MVSSAPFSNWKKLVISDNCFIRLLTEIQVNSSDSFQKDQQGHSETTLTLQHELVMELQTYNE